MSSVRRRGLLKQETKRAIDMALKGTSHSLLELVEAILFTKESKA